MRKSETRDRCKVAKASQHATPRHAAKGGRRDVGFLQGAGRQNKGGECAVPSGQEGPPAVLKMPDPKLGVSKAALSSEVLQRHKERTGADPVQSQVQPERRAATGGLDIGTQYLYHQFYLVPNILR